MNLSSSIPMSNSLEVPLETLELKLAPFQETRPAIHHEKQGWDEQRWGTRSSVATGR